MRPIRTRLRRNRSSDPAPARQSNSVDVLLARLNNVSQVGLLCLAVFGYFYTVRPAFQNARMAEEIAEKATTIDQQKTELLGLAKDLESAREITGKAKDSARTIFWQDRYVYYIQQECSGKESIQYGGDFLLCAERTAAQVREKLLFMDPVDNSTPSEMHAVYKQTISEWKAKVGRGKVMTTAQTFSAARTVLEPVNPF